MIYSVTNVHKRGSNGNQCWDLNTLSICKIIANEKKRRRRKMSTLLDTENGKEKEEKCQNFKSDKLYLF